MTTFFCIDLTIFFLLPGPSLHLGQHISWLPQAFLECIFLDDTRNTFSLFAVSVVKKIFKNEKKNQIFFSIYNLRTEEEARVTSLGRRSFIFWLTAVLCWINDRLYCEIWSSIGFPYLHGFWHVLIFLAAYTAVVLFAYFDVKQNHPHETPLIQYWPIDSFELGIPYCQLKSYHLNKKEHHI